jgi:hypothetical protein
MEASNSSPGDTFIVVMVVESSGKSSYQAEYSATPFMESCSVPVWIRVLSNWPPIPIQAAEKVSPVETLTCGTDQEPATFVTAELGKLKSETTA